MAIILNIETATKNCSVSIADKGVVKAIKELNNGNYSHAEVLHSFIVAVLKEASINLNQIDAVAVSKGPGSYTGLRIGVSAAKGLSFSLNIPLISVDTLTALSLSNPIKQGLIVPMLDEKNGSLFSNF